ncbi:hypothetical protein RDI58_020754 [Solanum bulbocastanum]|uniref:Uncharacterized protein n=1 Tax=Solanum bulbocastanum TaxID=147425 RepID=A0AAN8T6V6_SOLBU
MASTKIKIPIIDFCNLELKPDTPQCVESIVNTFWSDGNPNFCNEAKSFYKPLMELDAC